MTDQSSKYQRSSIPSADEIRAATFGGGKTGTNKVNSDEVTTIGGGKKKDDDSDYDWDFEDQQEEARKKEKILKEIQDKKVVREYEETKAKGSLRFGSMNMSGSGVAGIPLDSDSTHAPDTQLDDLWLSIRNFFDDLTSKGDKREIGKGDKSNKLKFMESCQSFDFMDSGVISEANLMTAFSRSRFRPLPSQAQLRKLIKGCEAWVAGEDSDVDYRKILEAPVSREFASINGIFPKIKPKDLSQKQLEEQRKKEEEEARRREQLDQEERKRKEAADKKLADFAARRGNNQLPTKEELKMKEREDFLKREADAADAARKQREEAEKVRKEVSEYRRAIDEVQRRVRRGGENIRNWFTMFDANKDGVMEPSDFKGLLRHADVIVRDQDLLKVFELIDLQQTGKISYSDFLNVVEKNVTLPIEQLVKKRRRERGEAYIDTEDMIDPILFPEEAARLKAYKTYQAEITSSGNRGIGTVEGISQIMKRSEDDTNDRNLVDDDDALNHYNEIKEALKTNFNTFDDILQKMGVPAMAMQSNVVTFRDFEVLIRAMPQGQKFSIQQLKNVFMNYASGVTATDASIKTVDFKDRFFPGIHWRRVGDGPSLLTSHQSGASLRSADQSSQAPSMHVDNILQGIKQEDLAKMTKDEGLLKQKEDKYKRGVKPINEDLLERQSQSSMASQGIDDILTRGRDPRKSKNEPNGLVKIEEEKMFGNQSSFLSHDDLKKFKLNEQFFRQNEAIMNQIPIEERFKFDKSLDIFFQNFCKSLIKEISNGPVKRDITSYVDHYGKEVKGFLTFPEFKEIYTIHVQANISTDDSALNAGLKGTGQSPVEEGKLRALFGIFDGSSLGRVSQQDFARLILSQAPSNTVLERLRNKVKKAGLRMINVLSEEFQNADMPYGCQGQLPISNFQTIMIDYDLPLMEFDMRDLRTKAFIFTDKQGNEYIKYKDLLDTLRPRNQAHTNINMINRMVTRIQAKWRGYLQRKQYLKMHNSEFRSVGQALTKVSQKGVRWGDEAADDRQGKSGKPLTAEEKKAEADKKRKEVLNSAKNKKKRGESVEARMGAVVKMPKDKATKTGTDKQSKLREELSKYIKEVVLENIITAAQCYGESLIVGRDIQKNFENRPVTKFVFPMIQEFQYNVMGVQPKTLQTLNELGQIMYLDSENQLNQYDIPTNRSLPPVNLGTRPPLKHYDIIDMVCDQTSGRIYTLNQNWILEIWNIEQNVSLPQKRISVCSNEGGKDYIGMFYKNTFNNAKPRFLSLSDHNQQILIVNTSCVDGCIVFIDPISFSVLKKIQLRYQDYEIPKRIRESISYLKDVFKNIITNTGKTIFDIFADITNKQSGSIKIKDFILKLAQLDNTQNIDDLFQTCIVLDSDGNGDISFDEFLHYFEHLEVNDQSEYEKLKAEEEMFQNIWPEWIIRESKMDQAKVIVQRLYEALKRTPNISAEQAFQIFDSKEKGLVTQEYFRKVLSMFFQDAQLTEEEIDFVQKLTPKTVDQQFMYREFCKFIDKRFIRTFAKSSQNASLNAELQKELEQELRKEASLNYIIRKCHELGLDLRKILILQDQTSLNVIPRARFQRMLENLPLGLLPYEIEEIFDNDLNFDNYGNVDYTVILQNELFVNLEQQRLRREQLIRKAASSGDGGESQKQNQELADHRKVVVEDLVYIDDLEIIIYTTIMPKTSTIFVTHTKKKGDSDQSQEKKAIFTLENISKGGQNQPGQEQEIVQNRYDMLAKLRGHRNTDPPTICYVAQSGCLVSGEKHLNERHYQPNKDSMPRVEDSTIPLSHKFQKSSESAYERHSSRESNSNFKSEIIIWNLQRDMIELFQTNPPWNVPVYKRFDAHNASIIDICYLQKVQLLVSTSTDQTIRFWDPVSVSYELTDPNNIPHAMQRPGYYRPLSKETTKNNITFKEVKRIYTGTDSSCYSLRCLNIANVHIDPTNPEIKSQIEWLIGLKLGKPSQQGKKNTQIGFVCGYGVERVKIEVPALHHDDVVPPFVLKECEDLVQVRRRRVVTAFQHQLPHKIQKIYSQVSLQNSYMSQIRKLFLQAILQRKDLKYVNPEPLREIYKIILKLPNRNKFENFLATSGCSDKLSVSETFFYLQKFMQIHPLRTTQIEFEKSIDDFQKKHSREFLRGTKRWPKESIQKFANFIRTNGLDVAFLQRDTYNPGKLNDFCTRERFLEFFNDVAKPKNGFFSDQEIDSILNELDPYYTGIIQIALLQTYYREEIHFYNLTTLNRPKQIFTDIRSKVFPNRKLALQQALVSVDTQGDGYIRKEQFVEAFDKAGVKEDRDVLEFLFDMVGERYNTTRPADGSQPLEEERVLSVSYFINKLFNAAETVEINEIDQILQSIKATLVYKGLDYSVIFAEQTSVEDRGSSRRGKSATGEDAEKRKQKVDFDLTSHYTRFSQQMVATEFCRRISSLKAYNLAPEQIQKLANFLSLNQKNQTIVYLNAWLHHLRRVGTAFHIPNKEILPVICSKLLRNETVFRSYAESTAELKGMREDEKIIEVADLRQVLVKFGVNYINQDIFVNEFTRNQPAHLEDLITRMKNCVKQAYSLSATTMSSGGDSGALSKKPDDLVETLKDLRKTDYFDKVQMKLKKLGNRLSLTELVERMKSFDEDNQGRIKIHHFINVLKHNYASLFDQETLIGLQFELECLSPADNCVDYEEFVKLFLDRQGAQGRDLEVSGFSNVDKRVSTFQIQDYEDMLSRISMHVKQEGLDLMRIFKIFAKQQGQITYEHLRKIFDLIGFQMNEQEFNLLTRFADESGDGWISAFEFANQIVYAKELAPQFDINKWIVASRYLQGNGLLLERVNLHIDVLKDILQSEYSSQSSESDGRATGVLTGEQFGDLLRDAKIGLSEHDLDLLTVYSIKGSRRLHSADAATQAVNTKLDLIQFFNFEKALEPVMKHLRKEEDDKRRKMEQAEQFDDEVSKMRKEIERREKEAELKAQRMMDPMQKAREQALVSKIIDIFCEREITFFDCFHSHYDPLNPSKNIITISQFKRALKSLNLPLTVQEHRILRRMADPQQLGKVELQHFCLRFETEDLRLKRLSNVIERVATAFYVQNFNLRRAFQLFDRDGDGQITKKEFRQGWLTLGLDLTFEEIDDLMKLVDSDGSGNISFDEFISKMDVHLQKKSPVASEQAQEQVFHKLKSLIENSQETLYEIMATYDFDDSGTILSQDLVRSFKKLGMLHPEPHIPMLLEAGGAHSTSERIDYVTYCQLLEGKIAKQIGLNIKRNHEIVQMIAQSLATKKMSPFEFFSTLDVNNSSRISKIEFKTGMQSLGISMSTQEFNDLWRMIKKPVKKMTQQQLAMEGPTKEKEAVASEDLSYIELLEGFNSAGCFKYAQSMDTTNTLMNKFRQQLKKRQFTVEKAYRQYDPDDNKFVFKHDFAHECVMMGLEFSEEELGKIFEYICQVGTKGTDSKDQQTQQIDRKATKSTTRFTYKQLHDAVLVQRDENWLFNAFIKIHGMVLQKNATYKRLFSQWRDKNTKAAAGRLASKELRVGLKKLRAGLSQDEIEKMMSSIPFEGKDSSISATEFERLVIQGAKKLENEREYEKLALQDWITTFNQFLQQGQIPLERVFQEHDMAQKGSLNFEDFAMMNEFIGLATPKKELKRTFDIIDKQKTGRIRLEDIKSISNMISNEGDSEANDDQSAALPPDELKLRQELDDMYEQVKDRLEKKNTTFEQVIYEGLKYMPNQFLNLKGTQQIFDKIQIVLSKNEAEKVLNDVRKYYNGKFECSFKDFVDFMTRKRINSAFADKGFVDPMIAQCCQQLNRLSQAFDISFEQIFDCFDQDRKGRLQKTYFLKCMQGMELGIASEDLVEFFNFIDEKNENKISKLQFVDSVNFVVTKIGGGSKLEQALAVGASQAKKGHTVKQMVFNILKKISEAVQTRHLAMRQVIGIFDQSRTGYISRNDFANTLKTLEGDISLEEARALMTFFDDKNTGKISVVEIVKSIQDIIQQQQGGGLYAFMQVQPIIHKIVNELAIDCDKFFDQLADLNEQQVDEEIRNNDGRDKSGKLLVGGKAHSSVGLSKRLFFSHLQKYGVDLDEDEKTLMGTVFTMAGVPEKFDYEKVDAAFEGVQSQLYVQQEQFTIEWQRRIFRKIGEYLRKHNITIHKCFNFIDEDKSSTVSLDELRQALIRFQISDLSDKELKVFLSRLDEDKKGYITQQQFLKKFWAAYTYDDVFQDQEGDTAASRGTMIGTTGAAQQKNMGLSEKIKRAKMFGAIQQKLKMISTAQDAFARMDRGVGFLTVRDMQTMMPQIYGVSLKREDFLRLFKEIDTDKDGIIKYSEFEEFYNRNYNEVMKNIEKEKEKMSVQYEIFDHLMKVLNQKSLSLAEVFHQIDTNQNGFIECDEFQNLLERLGFTISENQIYEIMRQMDENFDGRISYQELRMHIKDLGFSLDNEGHATPGTIALNGRSTRQFVWRDKTIEVVIRMLHKIQANGKGSIEEYFKPFDRDHDNHLTPSEFREALQAVKDSQLKKFQIERLLHVLIDEKKAQPVINISKISKFLRNYQYIDKEGLEKGNTSAILIDEDLFVYIVERYDGFSRLVDMVNQLDEKAGYLQRHVFEINLRGLNMLSNQKTVEKLHRKSAKLNEIFESALVLLAGESTRLMKEEAQLCVLDPQHNINTIVNDQNAGFLASLQIPTIENSAFDIDFATLTFLPSGGQRYMGVIPGQNQKVEVLIYPNEDLNFVSADGKTYKKHLQLELQVHRYLMGAQFEDELHRLDPEKMDIFGNIGKFEKKIGLAESDKEIYVVNENIDTDEWICLEDFVERNGGILNIPLFYHTDAPLFIIRYWAKKILQIIHKLHEVGVVMRSLNLKQIYLSRDGQRMKLANVRGVGKVNNLGTIQACPDIYLSLENNSNEDRLGGGSTTTMTPGLIGGNSSKKTEAQKQFSNRALDNPFIAPEVLFTKFSDQTSALDVWSFGMIMYSLLLGRCPDSFYTVYRRWYKRQHGGYDIELSQLPFISPSKSNFLYDPFTVDFDNPFSPKAEDELEITNNIEELQGSLIDKQGSGFNFENVMKCIKNLSISSLFEGGNSKKFTFQTIAQQIENNKGATGPPRFPGQSHTNQELRHKILSSFAKGEILERKNELGLILDLVASCLDMDPKKRPTINGLLNSPLFQMDKYELTNAVRFSQNVILYRSPQSSVSLRITAPLRQICSVAIKNPTQLFNIENDILKMFIWTEECVSHITSLPLDQINEVLTEEEKRKSLMMGSSLTKSQFQGKDFSQLRVSPNSPLAAQIIEDKVIDMLIFLTFRYTKVFNEWRNKRLSDINRETHGILKAQSVASAKQTKSVKFDPTEASERTSAYKSLNQQSLNKKQTERLQNLIIQRLTALLKMLVYEMHSYNTPMAPFVKEVMEYIVKFYVGEEYELGSDFVLRRSSTADESASNLKEYLRGRSFFRRENELDKTFKSDHTDKMWHLEQRNKTFLDKSNYWNTDLHAEALKIYKDAITESGMGQSCYPVINDYITSVSNSFEPSQVFSKQMNQLCLSFLIPFNRTSQYYNELTPLTECLARLAQGEKKSAGATNGRQLEKAGKRCSLAVVRSVFQTGSSDKIKSCLDMRVPKHIIHFLQDEDSEVRHECLLIFFEISKGLQDDDFEIMLGKTAANIKLELSKRAYRRSAFDQHKTLSLVSQQTNPAEELPTQESASKASASGTKRRGQPSQQTQSADIMANYIKRTTALIEKNDNNKFINFALDLPNLNFLANKRFLKELAICFESPVFIAPLIRLLKSPTESFANKDVILQILANLFCGNEKVLIAINSPACDTYMTLLKMLMQNTKTQAARGSMGSSGSGLSAQMRQQLILQDKVVDLFKFMFEQRRPTMIRDLSCNGASSTLLKEQGLKIPQLINLPEIVAFVDEFHNIEIMTPAHIHINDFLTMLKDLRCWIKHFYAESQIPELTRIKALQRCVNLIIKVVRVLWADFHLQDDSDIRADYLILMKAGLQLLDWLCVRGQEHFIFNDQNGKHNLEFVIDKCNFALSAFRHPQSTGSNSGLPMEDLAFNMKNNKDAQQLRKFDMFPFTEIGAILQNILYHLVRKNDTFINQLLAEVDFGFIFGEQLILEYDFIRHCIHNKIESMVLIDTYVKKNEIRLNTYESILRSNEHTLKTQFIKSNFFEKLFSEYITDFKEFNIQFSKIDLEFLAFRKTFPIRLEAISLLNSTLVSKDRAPSVFTEVIMYARRHFLIRNEVALLRKGGSRGMSTHENTALLLFSIILESNEQDLIYAMMQEGAHKVIRDMMKEYPSLNKRYPLLAAFTNKF